MYRLYSGKYTRGILVEMVMTEGEIEFERMEIDILRGEEKKPEYLAINPAGWVPALVCPDGGVLTETPAINLYLGERHRITSLVPAVDDPDRGPFLSALFYITDEIEPALKRYWYPHTFGDGDSRSCTRRRAARFCCRRKPTGRKRALPSWHALQPGRSDDRFLGNNPGAPRRNAATAVRARLRRDGAGTAETQAAVRYYRWLGQRFL